MLFINTNKCSIKMCCLKHTKTQTHTQYKNHDRLDTQWSTSINRDWQTGMVTEVVGITNDFCYAMRQFAYQECTFEVLR